MNLFRRIRRRLLDPVATRIVAGQDRYWYEDPLGSAPRAEAATYRALWEEAKGRNFPDIDAFEAERGHALDKDWLDALALKTQIVIKDSRLNYQHGRVLYATLRRFLEDRPDLRDVTILETGTARGFSALCMARALRDVGAAGRVLTMDVLPHDTPMYWNCIADAEGRKSRRELLEDYTDLLDGVLFLQGDTRRQIARLGLGRVPFAYLDAQHTFNDVMAEAGIILPRQQAGDIIVFDDVTETVFPGVCRAVEKIETEHGYRAERLQSGPERGYAILTKSR
ncbi:MAG: class I SAM-dependent methyltransferase [Rhodospirillales bacterium]